MYASHTFSDSRQDMQSKQKQQLCHAWCHGGLSFLYTQCWGLTNRATHRCSHLEILNAHSIMYSVQKILILANEIHLLIVLPYILNCCNQILCVIKVLVIRTMGNSTYCLVWLISRSGNPYKKKLFQLHYSWSALLLFNNAYETHKIVEVLVLYNTKSYVLPVLLFLVLSHFITVNTLFPT